MVAGRAVPLTGADQTGFTGAAIYCGFSIRETAGSTAVVRIHDAISATGTILDSISLSANESVREWYPGGIRCATGIFVDIVSGTVEGSLRIG